MIQTSVSTNPCKPVLPADIILLEGCSGWHGQRTLTKAIIVASKLSTSPKSDARWTRIAYTQRSVSRGQWMQRNRHANPP